MVFQLWFDLKDGIKILLRKLMSLQEPLWFDLKDGIKILNPAKHQHCSKLWFDLKDGIKIFLLNIYQLICRCGLI